MKKTEQPTQLKEAETPPSLEEQLIQQKSIAYDILAEQERLQRLLGQVNGNIESIVKAIQESQKESD